ncbi:MAG TPA: DUF3108 domain-containing protein [Burkholderiales bacterium]|nr:DUF3108 domain-containing protein [Burkholderiales bacterium]
MTRSAAWIALLLAAAVPAAAAPNAVNASYDVFRDQLYVGVVQETFEKTGNRYQVVSEINPAGIAALFRGREKLTSSGSIVRAGLRPEKFVAERSDDASKNVSAAFDWDAGLLRMNFDGREQTAPLAGGTQDRVSVMYQFLFLKAKEVGQLDFAMTNGRKTEPYRYRFAGDEQIATPFGKLRTLHLVKQREADDNSVEIWLARDRHLFPVRLLIVENDGTRFEQNITRLEFK